MAIRIRPTCIITLASIFLVAFALGGPAQLADWASVKAPSAATIKLEQSYVAVQDGQTVRAFSCMNRRWSSLTVSAGMPNLTILNDHFIVRDGTFFYGYSPRTGRFLAQLVLSPGARLEPRVSPQSWFSVVTDGNNIHVFQALDGVWTTYVFPTPPVVTMGRMCAVIRDGSKVYGLSAFYGTPVAMPLTGASVLGAYGNVGVASTVGRVHGFSAYTNTWDSLPVAGTPTVAFGDGQAAFVQIIDGTGTAFFSGHSGTFTTIPASASATVTLDRAVAIVADGTYTFGYSGLLGAFDILTTASAPVVVMQQFYALVDDGVNVRGFSANTGTFSPPVAGDFGDITTRAEMAYLQPQSAPYPTQVYSQFLNLWTPTPSLSAATPYITAGSVVLVEPNGGIHGLSLRGTKWIYENTPIIDTVHVGSNRPKMEQTLVCQAANRLWAFNARTRAWRMTTTNTPVKTFHGNNTALITIDGSRAYGFSNWSDKWSFTTLDGPVLKAQAQVQSAYIQTATSVYGYAGVGQLSTSHDYPEYWRAASQGSRVRIDLAAEPGSSAMLAVSLGAASIPLPPHGTLLLDPARMLVLATPGIPGGGLFGLNFQVPTGPAVRGVDLHFQAAVFGGTSFYLTNAIAIRLL